MSSSWVYRVPPSKREPTKETDMLGGFSNYGPHYAMSKLATEAVVRFQARVAELPTLIAPPRRGLRGARTRRRADGGLRDA